MSYLRFEHTGVSASGKTQLWDVVSERRRVLGEIRWHGPWRQYTLFPTAHTVWNPDCLREVADFAAERTAEHRA